MAVLSARAMHGAAALAALLLVPHVLSAGADAADIAEAQWAQYVAVQPKTILELQPFRQTMRLEWKIGEYSSATLINLNPSVNAWFVLSLRRADGRESSYHLENADPRTQHLTLDAAFPLGIRISSPKSPADCLLWANDGMTLVQARLSGLPYAPLCESRVFLRNAVPGTYTNLERITNLLRDYVWGGDRIVAFVREAVFQDAFREQGGSAALPALPNGTPPGPKPASLALGFETVGVKPEHLALDVGPGIPEFGMGRWYGVSGSPGIFLSVIQAHAIAPGILKSRDESVNALDAVESDALNYLVAFDLAQFNLGFELGTDHPRVGWSERALESARDSRLPGPDGIGQVAPLVTTGMVSPALVARTAATFAGGFKREHGAFRYGPLAEQNAGSHYGFIEQGAIFSKLQPGLATLLVSDSGQVSMKTWEREDDKELAHIRHARQNGVPLIEVGADGVSRPGPLVNRWGPGNWSGSSEEHLRTLRSGVCLQESAESRYLIYGYFSDATPSAMTRVFQAYGCRYAMHLDMNALEHTYLAVYTRNSGNRVVQHLIDGMSEVDRKGGDRLSPRFIGFPDDRDFFYLLRKDPSHEP